MKFKDIIKESVKSSYGKGGESWYDLQDAKALAKKDGKNPDRLSYGELSAYIDKAEKARKARKDEDKQRLDPKCWKGYKKQGTKMKGGVRVNNCVKEAKQALARHVKEGVPLPDSLFRYQSEAYFDTFKYAKQLREAGILQELDWESEEMLATDIGESVELKGVGRVWLDVPYLNEEYDDGDYGAPRVPRTEITDDLIRKVELRAEEIKNTGRDPLDATDDAALEFGIDPVDYEAAYDIKNLMDDKRLADMIGASEEEVSADREGAEKTALGMPYYDDERVEENYDPKLITMLDRFEKDSAEFFNYYGDTDVVTVDQLLKQGKEEQAAEEMAGAMADQDGGSDKFDEIYNLALDHVENYTVEPALAEMRKLAGIEERSYKDVGVADVVKDRRGKEFKFDKDSKQFKSMDGEVADVSTKLGKDLLRLRRNAMKRTSPSYKKAVGEGEDDNFTIDDIRRLERIKDLETIKAQAKELIKGKPARRMKPEKISYFYNKVDSLTSPFTVIKLMYDLLLAGEGHKVVGSKNSMSPNVYRQRFGEKAVGEVEYQGKDVELNKPKRGGSKKYYVYVKNPKTGNVKKISFGDPGLKTKSGNKGRAKSFAARHNCEKKNDKMKAGYWACRLPRYGLVKGGKWW